MMNYDRNKYLLSFRRSEFDISAMNLGGLYLVFHLPCNAILFVFEKKLLKIL
jgi:hypothetical protein